MQIITSKGLEPINFNKTLNKVNNYIYGLSPKVDAALVAQKTIERIADMMTTEQVDQLSAGVAGSMTNIHPDYSILGGRILMSRLHQKLGVEIKAGGLSMSKEISLGAIQKKPDFYNHLEKMNQILGGGRISNQVLEFARQNNQVLTEMVDYVEDYNYDYQALNSFLKRGLEKDPETGEILESPSQMFLKLAIGLYTWQDRNQDEMQYFWDWVNSDHNSRFFSKAENSEASIDQLESNSSLQPNLNFRLDFERMRNMETDQRLNEIKNLYRLLVCREISLPGPIMLNGASQKNQMASCYLQYCGDELTGEEYPIDGKVGGIMKAMSQLAKQSQGGGGNSIALHDLRSNGSPIKSTNGKSNGIIPFMKMFDSTIMAVNQSGKRAGTCVVYLEPWHADVLDFLEAASHFAIEEKRCKNLFFALYVCDLFFERMTTDKSEAVWTLFNPADVLKHIEKPLSDYYGEEFKQKYLYLESLGIGKPIKLTEIWMRVCHLFQTTGMPYIVNKDQMNLKSNQQNLGVIKSSNLCTEIALSSNDQETAVCVLSSLCLGRYVLTTSGGINTDSDKTGDSYGSILGEEQHYDKSKNELNNKFNIQIQGYVDYQTQGKDGVDYNKIITNAYTIAKMLNGVIDKQYYPTVETRNSCLSRRAIGVGVQGLADLFANLNLIFTSDEAKNINRRVYECIYFGALWGSLELSKKESPYLGFVGSPIASGKFQFDFWNIDRSTLFLNRFQEEIPAIQKFLDYFKSDLESFWISGLAKKSSNIQTSNLQDLNIQNPDNQSSNQNSNQNSNSSGIQVWSFLEFLIAKYGLRNSEVTALMPTAASSVRMSGNDMHEPYSRNIYVRQGIMGSSQVVNRYLVRDLEALGLWNDSVCAEIIESEGSIQNISQIPDSIKQKYPTVYEIDWKELVDMMADRAPFVSQTASFNHYTANQDSSPTVFTQKILYTWRKGLKTLSYYMHTETATTAKKEFGQGSIQVENYKTSQNINNSENLSKNQPTENHQNVAQTNTDRSNLGFGQKTEISFKGQIKGLGQNVIVAEKGALDLGEDGVDCEFCQG